MKMLALLLLFFIQLDISADSGLDWIRRLSGEWQGTFEWSGGRTGSGKMIATYHETGNGSAVVENLIVESKTVMTSVYHMDGNDLRMTHFCAAGNQPRLKGISSDLLDRRIKFSLFDITNLHDPAHGHVHKFEMHFKNENQITLLFTFIAKDKESYERIELTRLPQ